MITIVIASGKTLTYTIYNTKDTYLSVVHGHAALAIQKTSASVEW